MIWLLRALAVAGVGLISLAVWEQPRMADDWYLAWQLADAGSLYRFVSELYFGWGGRILPFVLAGLALSSEAATHTFKLLTVPCFMWLAACAYYLANGTVPRIGRDFLLVAAVLWLGVPAASETIVQTTGAAAYMWPTAAGLSMLCFFRWARDRAFLIETNGCGWLVSVVSCFAGIVVGTGNEQLVAGMITVLAGWVWMLWRRGRLRYLGSEAWWGGLGLIVGALVLIGAPGNYIRLSAPEGAGGIFPMMIQFSMYLGGAYFGLGTGDAGRALWLGVVVIALSGALTLVDDRRKDVAIWVAAGFASLVPMMPLVSFASPRTTFLTAIFLIIAVTAAFPRKSEIGGATLGATNFLLAFALAALVAIDGFVGWVANRALAAEMTARLSIIRTAAAAGHKTGPIPQSATIPSRLTVILNPLHDQDFGTKLAGRYGMTRERNDGSPGAPQPHSVNSLKSLKNSFSRR